MITKAMPSLMPETLAWIASAICLALTLRSSNFLRIGKATA